jgi:hypothetical protein
MPAAAIFFVILVVVVVEVVVIIVFIVVFPVLVVLFIVLGVFFSLRARPTLRFFGEFKIEFRPAVHIQLLDIPIEMLNLNGFLVFVHLEHLEGFLVFQVLVPLPDGRFVLSAHFVVPLLSVDLVMKRDIRGGRLFK